MKNILIFVISLVIVIGIAGCNSKDNNEPVLRNPDNTQNENLINISDSAFNPSQLTIKAGSTVTWRNNDTVAHTVDFTVNGEEIKSNVLNPGYEFNYTFKNVGTFDYICSIHPAMKGKIIVN